LTPALHQTPRFWPGGAPGLRRNRIRPHPPAPFGYLRSAAAQMGSWDRLGTAVGRSWRTSRSTPPFEAPCSTQTVIFTGVLPRCRDPAQLLSHDQRLPYFA